MKINKLLICVISTGVLFGCFSQKTLRGPLHKIDLENLTYTRCNGADRQPIDIKRGTKAHIAISKFLVDTSNYWTTTIVSPGCDFIVSGGGMNLFITKAGKQVVLQKGSEQYSIPDSNQTVLNAIVANDKEID